MRQQLQVNMCVCMPLQGRTLSAVAVALAFEAQMVQSVPTAPHDLDVDVVVTATNVFACSVCGQRALLKSAPP